MQCLLTQERKNFEGVLASPPLVCQATFRHSATWSSCPRWRWTHHVRNNSPDENKKQEMWQVLRVTLNRLPGTFRRHVSTGRHQTRPERAGSASELKPSETNATIAGVLCRRSLLVSTPPPTRLPFLPLRRERERKVYRITLAPDLPIHLEQ